MVAAGDCSHLPWLRLPFSHLRHREHRPQLGHSGPELIPLDPEGNDFVQPRPLSEVVTVTPTRTSESQA
jgi:hypothetical protein